MGRQVARVPHPSDVMALRSKIEGQAHKQDEHAHAEIAGPYIFTVPKSCARRRQPSARGACACQPGAE